MIIFGWRTIVRTVGAVFKKMCDHCHNEDYWVLTKSTRWFTLFFIPVLPLETKYFLACPVCQYGLVLNKSQVASIKPLAEANQLFLTGKISEAEHAFRVNQLGGQTITPAQNTQPELETLKQGHQQLAYCGNCGNKVAGDAKFCGNCGVATTSK